MTPASALRTAAQTAIQTQQGLSEPIRTALFIAGPLCRLPGDPDQSRTQRTETPYATLSVDNEAVIPTP